MAGERDHLADVHALVSHALEAVEHVQQRRDQPQVRGDRGLSREQGQDFLVHLQVAAVDAVVVGHDQLGQLDVLVLDRLHSPVEGRGDHVQAFQRAPF